jgi:hypothetical protein
MVSIVAIGALGKRKTAQRLGIWSLLGHTLCLSVWDDLWPMVRAYFYRNPDRIERSDENART